MPGVTSFERGYYALQNRLLPGLRHPQYLYLDQLLELLPAGTRWLDLGCGHQILPWRMDLDEKSIVERCALAVGADLDAGSLKNHESIRDRVLAKGEELPFPAGTFDLVTANMVVEHVHDPSGILKEIHRVLRPGGHFLFITPNRNSPYIRVAERTPERVKKTMVRIFERRAEADVFPTKYRMNTAADVRRFAAASGGFRVKRLEQRNSTAVTARLGPFAIPELLFLRLLQQDRFEDLRTILLVTLEKSQSGESLTARGGRADGEAVGGIQRRDPRRV